jgi:spermidine synthase
MSRAVAGILVFFTSAAVLVLEIMAGRLLAPYVGVTLETFTGIIGTVLAGISLGSWAGGRLADRVDPLRMLGPLLVAGGILSLLAPPIVDGAGPRLSGGEPMEIVVLAFLGFFAPALVLSAVTPTVVKIRLASLDETGTVVGRLSALGTAGAIFGTFATGFLLLAAFPSRPIILALGGALVLAGIALWQGGLRNAGTTGVAVVALAGLAALTSGFTDGPCERETAYFCARVEVDPNRPSGRILWLDTLRHSYVDVEDPTYLEFRYAKIMADVFAELLPARVDAVYVGGGGFTLPGYLAAVYPGSTAVVLELDPTLVDIAVDELGVTPGPGLTVLEGDARLTLQETPLAAFDLAVGDAFGGPAVPWHLTTREFVEDLHERLRPGGIYTLNLIDYGDLGFARAEAATIADVFSHVAVIAPPDYLAAEAGGNFVIVASDDPIDVGAISRRIADRGGQEVAITGPDVTDWIDGARVLTDGFAPVDQLITTR